MRFQYAGDCKGTIERTDTALEPPNFFGVINGRKVTRENTDGTHLTDDQVQQFGYYRAAYKGIGRHCRQPLCPRRVRRYAYHWNPPLRRTANPYFYLRGVARSN